jgi:Carboxypeptidase regulatory-like domain
MRTAFRHGAVAGALAVVSLTALPAALAGRAASARATLVAPQPFVIHPWQGNSHDVVAAAGRLTLGDRPVSAAVLAVAGFRVRTDGQGRFVYPLDRTVIGRYPIEVVDTTHAHVDGRPLSAADRRAVLATHAAVTVAYRIAGLSVRVQPSGNVLVDGRVSFAGGAPPPKVVLYGYRLFGRVRDARGRPVAGAIVSTRSSDAEGWTFSAPSNASGAYTSVYYPVDTEAVTLRVAEGDRTWELRKPLHLRRFESSRLDVTLPQSGSALSPLRPVPTAGAVYEGLLVGAGVDGRPVRPLTGRWPDRDGRFEFLLPRSARGRRLTFFESQDYYLAPIGTHPGGSIPLGDWPARLGADIPQALIPAGRQA